MTKSTAVEKFLKGLFSSLNSGNTRYAVMRNYDSLPYTTGESDLDILLHPGDEKKARAAIEEAIGLADAVLLGYACKRDFFTFSVLCCNYDDHNSWDGLLVDFFVEWRYLSAAHLVDTNLLNSRYSVLKDIRVLPKNLSAVTAILKNLLHQNTVPLKYKAKLAAKTLADWEMMWKDLSPIGRPAFNLLFEICSMNSDFTDLSHKSKCLRKLVLYEAYSRSPLAYFWDRCMHVAFIFSRFFKPPGLCIAVLGTDGVGKSTLISAISPVLFSATHGNFTIKHLRPGLLPPLSRVFKISKKKINTTNNPHGSEPSGAIGSLLRLLYLCADYILGYWLIIRPKISKSPGIIIMDRYAYDMEFDQRRFRIALPSKVVSFFMNIVPRPDIIFCLSGDPDEIASRKNELPKNEVERQIYILEKFAKKNPRALLINTEGNVERSANSVFEGLSKMCSARAKLLCKSEA